MATVASCSASFAQVVVRKSHDSKAVAKSALVPSASRQELKALRMAPSRSSAGAKRLVTTASLTSSRPGESATDTVARRFNESTTIAEKALTVRSREQFEAFVMAAEDKLVMLHIESDEECDLGDNPEAWALNANITDGTHQSMAACLQMKSNLARVLRDATDVVFLDLPIIAHDPVQTALARELGATRFPTVQYYLNGKLVWQHVGATNQTSEKIGEGVLYYGGQAAAGTNVNQLIEPINAPGDLQDFLDACAMPAETPLGRFDVSCEKQLAVLDVSVLKDSEPCLHVYPAVLALAKNTAGATRWARLLGDSSPEAYAMMQQLNVTSVPTFILYSEGKEVSRYTGSDRKVLMNTVLEFQAAQGVNLPQRAPRKRMTNAEARAIAKEARETQKKKNPFF
mmetsp:Transcript_21666/g.36217  ORF Transcript_21666/g.36217 Transcript_21666/m.36217 type:complete len:399 (-) Transcript_21666:181-1377(-)|eukprot:CAMPEP_0198208102 /NCGR_PEP_ID=MMETSP1445-20131203/11492_1 /TAXON_ID=36898 /ORGANISM="Pyramimonas sp., Strain CCMP2087" /LENGTH=398 /DNA_ID=CAMNT_0043881371 /DNA_START=87 /DNA_END=1283 /DNA_ORIENTATION=-